MISFHPPVLLVAVLALFLSSCSNAGKKKKEDLSGVGLLGPLVAEPVLTDETVERLQEIADAPSSSLKETDSDMADLALAEEDPVLELDESEALDFAPENPATEADSSLTTSDLVSEWKADGLNPRSIEIGDIFSDHAGPILKKAVSLADRLDLEDWTKTVHSVAEQRGRRVPVTLSVAEIDALKDRAPVGAEMPTRSVALDFRTISQSVKKPALEKLYELIENTPEGLTIADEKALKTLGKDLAEVKSRLKKGEQLYVITGVTSTDEMTATYPGAPLGTRDADLIQNAVTALYPHLDGLSADKEEESVRIRRDPSIYWEFEVRELKLEDDKLLINEEALAQL